jgi:hypothetical protein
VDSIPISHTDRPESESGTSNPNPTAAVEGEEENEGI